MYSTTGHAHTHTHARTDTRCCRRTHGQTTSVARIRTLWRPSSRTSGKSSFIIRCCCCLCYFFSSIISKIFETIFQNKFVWKLFCWDYGWCWFYSSVLHRFYWEWPERTRDFSTHLIVLSSSRARFFEVIPLQLRLCFKLNTAFLNELFYSYEINTREAIIYDFCGTWCLCK